MLEVVSARVHSASVGLHTSCTDSQRTRGNSTSSSARSCLSSQWQARSSKNLSTSFTSSTRGVASAWQQRSNRFNSVSGGRSLVVRADLPSVTEATFEAEVLKSEIPVLVDFWAPWCGPCKLVLPGLTQLDKEYEGKIKFVKVEADPNPTLVKDYKVYGLPFLALFQDGKVLFQHEGAINKAKLKALIDKNLPALVPN